MDDVPIILTHRMALEHRAAAVPLSACEGRLVFRHNARPGWSNTPLVYQCDGCGAALGLSERDRAVLWVLPTNPNGGKPCP